MNTKSSVLKLPALLVLCFAVAAVSAYAQQIFIDIDFESYTSTAQMGDQETGDWPLFPADQDPDLAPLVTQDPDGTTNQSVLMSGGVNRGWWEIMDLNPTDDEPIVFQFRVYDHMTTEFDEDAEEEVLVAGGNYAEVRAEFGNIFAAPFWIETQMGEFDVTRYQARVSAGPGWIQLAAERSEGWQEFRFVIFENSVDIYVNGELDPNGTAIPWNGGSMEIVNIGGPFSTANFPANYDDVYLAQDPGAARAIDIVEHPEGREVAVGFEFELSVVAEGSGTLTYQWLKDNVELADSDPRVSGATSDTLTITGTEFDDAGLYRVAVSDGSETTLSRGAEIDVQPFIFLEVPGTVQLEEGENAVFSVEVEGEEPFDYQWFRDGEEVTDGGRISGATDATLTLAEAVPADAGRYSVEVGNTHGSRETEGAALVIAPAPTGVRFADFEDIVLPAANGTVMFRAPSFSGSTSGNVAAPNLAQVTDDVPEGNWGAQSLLVNFSFAADLANPWLRLTTFNVATLGNPIISFEQFLRFDIHTNEDVYVTLAVRETHAPGLSPANDGIGEDGGTGDGNIHNGIEWIGGDIDPDSVPPKARLVRAGQWTTLYFDIPNELVTAFAGVGADGELDGDRGTIEHLAFMPVRDGDDNYPTGPYEIHLDNFEVTEVGPPAFVGLPQVAAGRTPDGNVRVQVTGEANASFALEVSGDLVNWEPLATIEADGTGVAEFIEEEVSTYPRRFYRVNVED